MDWRQDMEDAREFVDNMKNEVFEDRVYVFTPRGYHRFARQLNAN